MNTNQPETTPLETVPPTKVERLGFAMGMTVFAGVIVTPEMTQAVNQAAADRQADKEKKDKRPPKPPKRPNVRIGGAALAGNT